MDDLSALAAAASFEVPYGKYYGRRLEHVPVDYIIVCLANVNGEHYADLRHATRRYLAYLEDHPEDVIVPLRKYRGARLGDVVDVKWMRWCCTAQTDGMAYARAWHPQFMRIMEEWIDA